jgi:hypothetical protein
MLTSSSSTEHTEYTKDQEPERISTGARGSRGRTKTRQGKSNRAVQQACDDRREKEFQVTNGAFSLLEASHTKIRNGQFWLSVFLSTPRLPVGILLSGFDPILTLMYSACSVEILESEPHAL